MAARSLAWSGSGLILAERPADKQSSLAIVAAKRIPRGKSNIEQGQPFGASLARLAHAASGSRCHPAIKSSFASSTPRSNVPSGRALICCPVIVYKVEVTVGGLSRMMTPDQIGVGVEMQRAVGQLQFSLTRLKDSVGLLFARCTIAKCEDRHAVMMRSELPTLQWLQCRDSGFVQRDLWIGSDRVTPA
jgi:hypothetical protein